MTDYSDLLDVAVREWLVAAVAALTSVTAPPDRERTGKAAGSSDHQPRLLDAIEDVQSLVIQAADATVALTTAYLELEPVRVDDHEPRVPRHQVTDDPAKALATITPLLTLIRTHIAEIAAHPAGHIVTDPLDDLAKVCARKVKPAKPRKCPVCFTGDVYADLEHASGVCDRCERVVRMEVWLSVGAAAKRLDVTRKTITRWIDADAVDWREHGRHRQVELRSCQSHQEMTRHRRILNLTPNVH